MKKILPIFVAIICFLGITSCGTKAVESVDELIALGAQYLLEGNYNEAIITFEKVIDADAKNVYAYMGLGDANLGLGDYEPARNAYEHVIEIDGKYSKAYIGLADAYILAGNDDEAFSILVEGYKITKDEKLNEIIEALENHAYEAGILHEDWLEILPKNPEDVNNENAQEEGKTEWDENDDSAILPAKCVIDFYFVNSESDWIDAGCLKYYGKNDELIENVEIRPFEEANYAYTKILDYDREGYVVKETLYDGAEESKYNYEWNESRTEVKVIDIAYNNYVREIIKFYEDGSVQSAWYAYDEYGEYGTEWLDEFEKGEAFWEYNVGKHGQY